MVNFRAIILIICVILLSTYTSRAAEEESSKGDIQDGFLTFESPYAGSKTTMHIELVNQNADLKVPLDNNVYILVPDIIKDLNDDIACSYAIGKDVDKSSAIPFASTDVMVLEEDSSYENTTPSMQIIQMVSSSILEIPSKSSLNLWCTNIVLPDQEISADWISDNMDKAAFGVAIINPEIEDADPLIEEYFGIPPILSKTNELGEEVSSDKPTYLLVLQGKKSKNLNIQKNELKAFCVVIDSTLKNGVSCKPVDGSFQNSVLYITFTLPTNKNVSQDQLQARLDKKYKSLTRFANDMLGLNDVQLTLHYSQLPTNIPKITYVPTTPEQLEKQRQIAQDRFKNVRSKLSALIGQPAAVDTAA